MCYSAQVWQDYRQYMKSLGALMDIKAFYNLFWRRNEFGKIKVPRGMTQAFSDPQNEDERQILDLIKAFEAQETSKLEQELFKQRTRLADAQRKLAQKLTKAATDSQRIATDKVDWIVAKLSDLRRTQARASDSRIYPGHYAPVMVWEGGRRVIRPMRYQCRPAGKPASYDTQYPGTYNARRDNLRGFWKNQFGHTHALMVVNAFYEHVAQPDGDGTKSVILEFNPSPSQDMLVACLWSRWSGAGEPDLLSFAAITDEPPPEIAAAGHDRCIIPIKPQNIDAWLRPDPTDLDAQEAILDDRERPYYEHRLAA